MHLWEVDSLNPVVIVKFGWLHLTAVDRSYLDPMLLIREICRPKIMDCNARDGFDLEVVLRKPHGGRIVEDIRLLTDNTPTKQQNKTKRCNCSVRHGPDQFSTKSVEVEDY